MRPKPSFDDEIAALIAAYRGAGASPAYLLCDRRPARSLAFRIVAADGTARDLTYGDLRAASESFAASLARLGIGAGDRVATLMGKSRDYLVALLATWRLGAVHVPLFTAFAPAAAAYRMAGAGVKVVICDEAQRNKLLPGGDMPDPLPWVVITTGPATGDALPFQALATDAGGIGAAAIGGSAPFIHIYTSGTTGRPKGVVVPLKALASFHAYAHYGLDLRADDLYWCAADPGWAYGLYYGIVAPLITATPSLLYEGNFSADAAVAILQRHGVTNFAAAPTAYRAIRAAHPRTEIPIALRCASSAGEPLNPDINVWARSFFGVPILDHYGQTETGMLINNHQHPLLREAAPDGSMGRAMPGWAAGILKADRDEPAESGEVGRIAMDLAASPVGWFDGYSGDDGGGAKFTADGRWYITGDTGRTDAQGRFYFSGRDDDVILMAGYRIGPDEIEGVIASHPAIAECAVIAVPDTIRGEIMEAHVVLRPGMIPSSQLSAEIQTWVKERYAAHAYPRVVAFVARLPRTPSGKLQRAELRRLRQQDQQGGLR